MHHGSRCDLRREMCSGVSVPLAMCEDAQPVAVELRRSFCDSTRSIIPLLLYYILPCTKALQPRFKFSNDSYQLYSSELFQQILTQAGNGSCYN